MFEYHPTKSAKRLQLRCSFTIVIVFWNWHCRVMSLFAGRLRSSAKVSYKCTPFFPLFLFGVCCLLICLFGPSARCLPERKVLQTEGKDQCWGSSLLLWKTPIPILQIKLNRFQFRFHFDTRKWNWVSKKINYSFSFDFDFWKLKFGFGLVLSNSHWNQWLTVS